MRNNICINQRQHRSDHLLPTASSHNRSNSNDSCRSGSETRHYSSSITTRSPSPADSRSRFNPTAYIRERNLKLRQIEIQKETRRRGSAGQRGSESDMSDFSARDGSKAGSSKKFVFFIYLKGEQLYGSRIAALDLGGGSTQITYNSSLSNTSLAGKLNLSLKAQQPIEPGQINAFRDPANKKKHQMPRIDIDQAGLEEMKPVQVVKQQNLLSNGKKLSEEEILMAHMHQFRMFRRDIELYSRSYLGYGLMIARQLICLNETNDPQLIECHQLRSRCFLDDVTGKFKFQEVTWTVQSHKGYFIIRIFQIKLVQRSIHDGK